MKFEIYPSGVEFRWRLLGGNNEPIAQGESYKNKRDCEHAVRLVQSTNTQTPIVDLTTSSR